MHKRLYLSGYIFSILVWSIFVINKWFSFSLDLQVFQDAGLAFLRHSPLYLEYGFHSRSGYAFIYPPFAALLFALGANIPQAPAQVLWEIICIILPLWLLLYSSFRVYVISYPKISRQIDPVRLSFAFIGIAGLTIEILPTSGFGQIDLVLAAMVVIDLFLLPKKWQGLLIGLAAGIKITPLAFVVPLLAVKRWWSVVRVVVTVIVTVLVGFLVRPQDSRNYWFDVALNTDRAGVKAYFENQAISGPIARWMPKAVQQPLWVIIVLLVLVVVLIGAYRYLRVQNYFQAFMLWILAVLLCQPYAVFHHWSIILFAFPLFHYFYSTDKNNVSIKVAGILCLVLIYNPVLRFVGQQLQLKYQNNYVLLLVDTACFAAMILLILLFPRTPKLTP